MRETVLKYGASDKLVTESRDRWDSGNAYKDKNTCAIITEDLFIIHEGYKKAIAEYEAYRKDRKHDAFIENVVDYLLKIK